MEKQSWVEREHPWRRIWAEDEARQRASYHARRKDLAEYLVPHRFERTPEVKKSPANLDRADLGYGIGLNRSYLSEIFGHVRSASAEYTWGPLVASSEVDEDGVVEGAPPSGTLARTVWEDATRENTSWRNFFLRKVLEWMLTSPGGFVVVDVPAGPRGSSEREDRERGRRPYVRFAKLSDVVDLGRSGSGFRWIKLREKRDTRSPDGDEDEIQNHYLLYRLAEGGRTRVTRYDERGEEVVLPGQSEATVDMGVIRDKQGEPVLPLVPAMFGEHADIPWLGAGLLPGLDDIVIDLFNAVSEMRAGYRDLVVAFLAYVGPNGDKVEKALESGTRYLDLGDNPDASINRVAADSAEVDAGVTQVELALRAWAEGAKRKGADAVAREMSGIALQAEFQLDLAPLLREITEELDDVESNVMHRLAQVADETVGMDQIKTVGVKRNRDFRPEDEASRIARIVEEFRPMVDRVPSQAQREIVMRWLEATGIVNLDQTVVLANGDGEATLRELLPDEVEELAEVAERRFRQQSDLTAGIQL